MRIPFRWGAFRAPRLLLSALVVLLALPCAAHPARAQNDSAGGVVWPGGLGNSPQLRLRGFTDFDYQSTTGGGPQDGFHLGQFVLHATSALAKKVSFFGEISVTPHGNDYGIEVERAIVRFDYNDLLKLSIGRYHTPISYWNTAFHHGLWLQTTIRRPELTQFGTVFIPVHFVGVLAQGKLPARGAGLSYRAGVGNGRSDNLVDAGDAGDRGNNNTAWLVNLNAAPAAPYGLEVGGTVYRDRIRTEADEWIASGHVVWVKETPEVMAEFIWVRHDFPGTETFDHRAFYVQVADRLPVLEQRVKPYVRYEERDLSQGDPVYATLGADQVVRTGGVRIDVSDFAALKLEYRHIDDVGVQDGFYAQTCLTF